MATEIKQTQRERASWLINSLTTHCLKVGTSGGIARISSDGQYTKDKTSESNFDLRIGESFYGPPDHHSSTTIKLTGMDKRGLLLQYEMRFDHRSFGKDLISVDTGSVVLPLKASH